QSAPVAARPMAGERRAGGPPASAGRGPEAAAGAPSASGAQATVRRPAVVEQGAPDVAVDAAAGRRPRRRLMIAGLAAGVVVAVAVGATLAIGGGAKPAHAGLPPALEPADASATPVAAPAIGTPALTWSRVDPTTVRFSWTYSGAQPGDQYRWQQPGQGFTVTSTPFADVADPVGHQVCIQVQVGRGDGSASSDLSDPVCGG
ncbi:MAG TPA: hypothetical protein VFP61_06085, partial [Acidimicrobiales bacterium]|nr:hypothetical protein [Acidimicrobiales bacterium]